MTGKTKQFEFIFDGQSHDALVLAKDPEQQPDLVFFHGAGVGSKSRVFAFADEAVNAGHSFFAFDHSGAGKDVGNLHKSSLERRTNEARFAIEKFADLENLTICGSSMGGHIALKMLEFFPVKNLILFCPGIYDAAAYSVPFNEKFSAIIRRPESWRDADILKPLEQFRGRLLIIIGELDAVIPPGVIELLDRHSPNVSAKEIMRVPACPHLIHPWLIEHPGQQHEVSLKVAEYCS